MWDDPTPAAAAPPGGVSGFFGSFLAVWTHLWHRYRLHGKAVQQAAAYIAALCALMAAVIIAAAQCNNPVHAVCRFRALLQRDDMVRLQVTGCYPPLSQAQAAQPVVPLVYSSTGFLPAVSVADCCLRRATLGACRLAWAYIAARCTRPHHLQLTCMACASAAADRSSSRPAPVCALASHIALDLRSAVENRPRAHCHTCATRSACMGLFSFPPYCSPQNKRGQPVGRPLNSSLY